jgi:hypothetical protein
MPCRPSFASSRQKSTSGVATVREPAISRSGPVSPQNPAWQWGGAIARRRMVGSLNSGGVTGMGLSRSRIRLATAITATVLAQVSGSSPAAYRQAAAEASFPSLLNTYITTYVRLTPAERGALLANRPVTRLLDAEPDKEVAVFGAVWIDALPGAYVQLVKDIEHFERGGAFRITKSISDPPQLADFALLTLPDEDIAALRACRVGDCEIKLSKEALERIRHEIDWKKPTARAHAMALFRRLMYEYATG